MVQRQLVPSQPMLDAAKTYPYALSLKDSLDNFLFTRRLMGWKIVWQTAPCIGNLLHLDVHTRPDSR